MGEETALPPSLSVYRGQARSGIGEGPDTPISHGEQYLRADPPLAGDGELLAAIRPWMSLDSDPADHQRLDNQLEAWSHFSHRQLRFVVRLTVAPAYDRRAAYFAHGRAWPLDPQGADVGLHLGRTEAFETPWRDERSGVPVPEPPPAVVRPEQVATELEVAALFAAHFHQAMVLRYPLVVAVPVADFRGGSAMHALVALSRALLPPALRAECRIRVYTRLPDLFLRHHGAHLVVVPEESAADALAGHREATLIDRRGVLRAGRALDPPVLSHAEALVERAIHLPEGLAAFGRREAKRRGSSGLPTAADARTVQMVYNLAYAFSGGSEQLDDLVCHYLPRAAQKHGPGLDWDQLIESGEWGSFPQAALLDLVLLDAATLPGLRELQLAVERALERLGRKVDSGLPDWWNPGDPAKIRRLLELMSQRPRLVSEDVAVALTAGVLLRELADREPVLVRALLAAELRQGRLGARSRESDDLVRLAEDGGVFGILQSAVEAGQLDRGWANMLVDRMSPASAAATAARFLDMPNLWQAWGDLPERLLARVRALESVLANLAPAIQAAGQSIDPAVHLETFLLVLDVLSEAERGAASPLTPPLVEQLGEALGRIEDPSDRERVVAAALARRPPCLQPSLLVCAGRLRAQWLEQLGARLLVVDEIAGQLETASLLALADHTEESVSLAPLYAALDRRMARDREGTTATLIRSRWWLYWRRASRLSHGELGLAARAWMASSVWLEPTVEATYETWLQGMGDLPEALAGEEMKVLCGGAARRLPGPVMPLFEEDQIAALAARASDLGALAELADAICVDGRLVNEQRWQLVLERGPQRFAALRPEAFAWLMESRVFAQRVATSLEESSTLCRYAGHRSSQALEARRRSVAARLEVDASEALQAAGEPSLWSHPGFLGDLAQWLCDQGSLDAIGLPVARYIQAAVKGEADRRPRGVSQELVAAFVNTGCDRVARLLSAERYRDVKEDELTGMVLRALFAGAVEDRCWSVLGLRMREWNNELQLASGPPRRHPLTAIAARIRDRDDPLSAPQQSRLGEQGWATFESVALEHGDLRLMACYDESIPAYELAASLLGPGAAGSAALRLMFSDASVRHLDDEAWWGALLPGVARRAAASADDWDDAALALLGDATDRLPPMAARMCRHAIEQLQAAA